MISATRSPHTAELERPHEAPLAEMDEIFLAVVVSGILVLIAAAGLFALAREKRGPGATLGDPPAAALRSLSAKRCRFRARRKLHASPWSESGWGLL